MKAEKKKLFMEYVILALNQDNFFYYNFFFL